jgi:PKD repeat protein
MPRPTAKHLFIGLLVVSLLISAVGAAEQPVTKININPSGITATDKTSINLTDGEMTFTDLGSGISVTAKTKIDGEPFSPDASVTDNGETTFARAAAQQPPQKQIGDIISDIIYKVVNFGGTRPGDIDQIGGITPDVAFSYTYTGNTVKETIVLQQDMELSFPVTIPAGQKMIHIKPDNWKIVNATNGNTMAGIVAERPFGVDAAGRNVSMTYTWDGSELHLVYNRTITTPNYTVSEQSPIPVYDYFNITYPLTIDPTWTQVGDHWVTYVMYGGNNYTVIKWNTTGTTSWTTPSFGSNFNLEYVIIAGGGAGGYTYSTGGGGAGGMINSTVSMTSSTPLTVTVGAGGGTNSGGDDSVLEGATAMGGGKGGTGDTNYDPAHCTYPGGGGSGGGGIVGNACLNSGGSYISGQGNSGGSGYNGINWQGGAGGGGGAGSIGVSGNQWYSGAGGSGRSNNITGDVTTYACGGGAYSHYGGSGDPGCSGAGGLNGGAVAVNGFGHGGAGVDGYNSSTYGGSGVVIVRYLTPALPVASFTQTNTSGYAPLLLQLLDTSTGGVTSWNWSYTNVTPGNNTEIWWTTLQNPIVTFGVGNWSIKLNAASGNGSNLSTQVTYINVSPVPPPVASFTSNITVYTMEPLSIQFYDTSTGTTPTSWNWSANNVTGNNTWFLFSTAQYPVETFGQGNWSIRLNASNVYGENTSTQITYINVTPYVYTPYTDASFDFNVTGLVATFTDLSGGDVPISWAWFFGDETYNQSWVQQNASAGWTGRSDFASVVMNDGSIVIMGGNPVTNDVWRSTDQGVTWTQQTASANWSARRGLRAVSLYLGNIILMGGIDGGGTVQNDIWWSSNYGANWTQMVAHANWSARYGHTAVRLNDGSLVLTGGWDGSNFKNDVWRSTNYGLTWTQQNASAPWSTRNWHSSVAMLDGSIIITGGNPGNSNDVWRSGTEGVTWTLKNASAGWAGRYLHTSVVMPDGSLVLMGGSGSVNDVWRSTNYGLTWTEINASAGWTGRYGLESLALPDGSILVMGGNDGSAKNDVWRFNPVGSSLEEPVHTYPDGPISGWGYSAAFQTSNLAGVSHDFETVTVYGTQSSGVGLLSIDGYVKDGETEGMVVGANVNVIQGSVNISAISNASGYYYATALALVPGALTTTTVTAAGYDSYQNVSTPTDYGVLRINHTLLANPMQEFYYNPVLGGIARTPPFNRTVDNTVVTIRNTTVNETYTATTNSAGYYLILYITPNYIYDVWGSKTGYANSTIYKKLIVGELPN